MLIEIVSEYLQKELYQDLKSYGIVVSPINENEIQIVVSEHLIITILKVKNQFQYKERYGTETLINRVDIFPNIDSILEYLVLTIKEFEKFRDQGE